MVDGWWVLCVFFAGIDGTRLSCKFAAQARLGVARTWKFPKALMVVWSTVTIPWTCGIWTYGVHSMYGGFKELHDIHETFLIEIENHHDFANIVYCAPLYILSF